MITNVTFASNITNNLEIFQQDLSEILKSRGASIYPESNLEFNYDTKLILNDQIKSIDLISFDKRSKSFYTQVNYESKKATKVNGKYFEFLQVPTLSKNFHKNDIISNQDITYIKTLASNLKKSAILDEAELINQTPVSSIKAFNIIHQSDITQPIIISKGAIVNLIYQKKNVTITMAVQAMDHGYMGTAIKVKNLKTGAMIMANVLNSGEVLVTR